MNDDALRAWIETRLGHAPRDIALFRRALTHGSYAPDHYERLEFLGDRVLGLIAGAWLYEIFPHEPEGNLSRRLNAIVSRETCAEIGREIEVATHLRLGKQARDDGAVESDNVLGDAVEALIGALYLEAGLAAAQAFVRGAWAERVTGQAQAPKHPKSALQEWAAAHRCKPPVYTMGGRSGPHHAPRFTVSVEIAGKAEASAEGSSKQEAETAAAKALLEKLA
ncbi:ribonuclease III [Sphingomonadaceae bacterium G21617-S1]|jgi:ribonuclease-3|uniref:ribonuclease III n=1 Tax=Rhizorhabdus sp. TaxID=1968843 RepID=UPI0019975DAA|nr:ribonuclease III [Rhizorhabdus sp.]MBD3760156.1 ribonuclease III [Rhizorhabdus sp.]MCZ4341237.1 ribonuclease III [Sphingomonadaceae bacterium G21617-S1]